MQQSAMTHLLILLDAIQKERGTNTRSRLKKEQHELAFRIQSNIFAGAFL